MGQSPKLCSGTKRSHFPQCAFQQSAGDPRLGGHPGAARAECRLLISDRTRSSVFFRAVFFLPYILGEVAAGLIGGICMMATTVSLP